MSKHRFRFLKIIPLLYIVVLYNSISLFSLKITIHCKIGHSVITRNFVIEKITDIKSKCCTSVGAKVLGAEHLR